MKNQEISPKAAMVKLSDTWSKRALRMLDSVPHNASRLTVLEFYWWFWSVRGKNKYCGFWRTPEVTAAGIGLKTYEEIRRCLLENRFPDLSDDMFSPTGFCSRCCPKSLLDTVLTCWKQASRNNKAYLRRAIRRCYCDGH